MIVGNVVPDPRPSGPLLRVLRVAERLKREDFEVHIITDASIDSSVLRRARDQTAGVHTIDLPRIRAPKRIRENFRFLVSIPWVINHVGNLLRDISADLIHVNGWLTLTPAIGASRVGIPVLWHINDMLVPKPLAKVTKPIINHYSDVIAVASEAVAEYFFDDRNKTEVLYSQVDTKRFSSTAISDNKVESLRAELDINKEMRVVGTVGNVSPNKAHDVLIQAIPSILKQHPKTVFVIVGSNLDSQSNYYQLLLQEAENLGVSSQIIFTGFRTDIPAMLSLFDIFVFPSRSEACPQSVLEAMSMETPVVASRTGGIVEQIEQSKDGLLIPTDNPDALSKAINNLLSSPQKCERLGKHARQTVVNRFSIQRCVDRHKHLYDMTLS